MAVDKATALAKIPTDQHDVALALEAQGFDWSKILILIELLRQILDLFKQPQFAKVGTTTHHCDQELKDALLDSEAKACEACCAACYAACLAGCHDH